MILWIIKHYFTEIADIQTVLLYGDLEEEIIIKIPLSNYEFLRENGAKIERKHLRLVKATYGLVHTARSWWKKFTTTLKDNLKFEQYSNQCNRKFVLNHLR